MESHILEQQEYNDRYNLYQHKIHQLWNTVNYPRNEPTGLLRDISNPQAVLSQVPIPQDEITQVSILINNFFRHNEFKNLQLILKIFIFYS